ncbi:MAG: 30S ribosomal protein S8e [Candidatus Diapherotrites archaeon]|uniref:30S ribosomal protein S8e n=1 Tax=Candidatus Iainarchaeum sp. TaxID=3101447 RepID=A0A8T4LEB5_9ARCH|nr:30S ribosomal protein S8e [Candidatus Diapherotrites archaeon]
MVNWDKPSLRKPSGGLNNSVNARDKKESEKGGVFSETKIAPQDRKKTLSSLGGNTKIKHLLANKVTVTDSQTKKNVVGSLITVRQNDANRQYARRNILTRGAIVEVELGNATRMVRITSRPGHSGGVNAVLLAASEEKAFSEPKASKAAKKEAKKETPKPKKPASEKK